MSNKNDYHTKYLKYKDKYYNIKNHTGGTSYIKSFISGKDKKSLLYDIFLNQPYKYFFIKGSVFNTLIKEGKPIRISSNDMEYYQFTEEVFFKILNMKAYFLNTNMNSLSLIISDARGNINSLFITPEVEEKNKEDIIKANINATLLKNKSLINDKKKNPDELNDLYKKALFTNIQTRDYIAKAIGLAQDDLNDMYTSADGKCDYMIGHINKVIFDFTNNIDSAYTKAMLMIDSIIKYKEVCLYRTIILNEEEKFTSLNNAKALAKIKFKIDKAFIESNNIIQSNKDDTNNEVTDYVIQVLIDKSEKIILLMSYKRLDSIYAPEPEVNMSGPDAEYDEPGDLSRPNTPNSVV